MRIVLDTNVLIAAFAARGLCHALFEVYIDRHELIGSEEILSEVRGSLAGKLKLPVPVIEEIDRYLRENMRVEQPEPLARSVCRDPGDDHILALAEKAHPDYVITGDEDLLVLENFLFIPIVSPLHVEATGRTAAHGEVGAIGRFSPGQRPE